MSCLVNVDQGTLRGKLCNYNGKEYYSFEGIPYAKPPLGKLRFREPQEPESWTGIREALKPGNSCIQVKPGTTDYFGSEDCLYLNIYTPSLPEKELKKLPVLVYIHGGKLLFGYGDYYRPEYLIEQDVILVTVNFRLHVLGFLCLHIPEAAGNMALKDTVMSLKWVKKNINKFNGDNNNIIAIGESAGSAIVTSYLTTKMADGLVNKVIALSGCCLSDLFIMDEDPIFKAQRIADILQKECKDITSLYEYLIQLPIEKLLYAATVAENSRPPGIISSYFLPVIEHKFEGIERFYEEYPVVTLKENRHKKLPILFGVNTHEGAFFIQQNKKGDIIYQKDLRYFLPRYLNVQPYSPEANQMAKKIRNFYFNGNGVIDETKKLQYVNLMCDVLFNRDILTFINYIGHNCDQLYLFRLSHVSNMNTRKMKLLDVKGTAHGDILQYIFYKKNKADVANEKDREIITIVNEIISNFGRTGVPSWSNKSFEWKPYKDNKRYFVDIEDEPKLLQDFGYGIDQFWRSLGERSKL